MEAVGPLSSTSAVEKAFIATHPELRHVRPGIKSPGQNGSRERGFGTLQFQRLFLVDIPDALDLISQAEAYRVEYNTVRPQEHQGRRVPSALSTATALRRVVRG